MPRVVVDTREFEGEVRAMADRCKDFRPVLKQWAFWKVQDVKLNFEAQGFRGDSGVVKWTPLKVRTLIERVLRRGREKRRADGKVLSRAETLFKKGRKGAIAPSASVFKKMPGTGGVGALSTISGFLRNKSGKVARSNHRGFNKIAPAGFVFRSPIVKSVLKGKILQDFGILMKSFTSRTESIDLESMRAIVGSADKRAAAHNFGYPKNNIPARQIIGITDEDGEQLQSFLYDHIRGVS